MTLRRENKYLNEDWAFLMGRPESQPEGTLKWTYKIIRDTKTESKFTKSVVKIWLIKNGAKIKGKIATYKPDRFDMTYGSMSYGPLPTFEMALAKFCAVFEDYMESFSGEGWDITPIKKGGEWSAIEVRVME